MMKKIRMKKQFFPIIFILMIVLCSPVHADACSLLYAGGDMTDDGADLFMRCEEIEADSNKLYYVSPAGKHKKGELYHGCSDFTWTFTHDSYRYTAQRDDNLSGVCPSCGGTHEHTPYEEAGTNDHGVTVSASQSLDANEKIAGVDPFTDGGITEAEIATVLLSEAATAREGVELLLSVYDSVGAGDEGSGVMICDQQEQWYIENLSGHEYIAVLLPRSVAFMQFNVSVLGRIDLDDTEHVIASSHLIDTAKKAGTFVGDEKQNVIDYRASFNDYLIETQDEEWNAHIRERLTAALGFLTGSDEWDTDSILEDNPFVMTNMDDDGSITALHNPLALKEKISLENAAALFRVYPIGYDENVNTHLYRFYPDREQTLGTVEWFAMDNCMYNVFVPSYPMLLTDTWDGYKIPLDEAAIMDQEPESSDFYFKEGEYHIHPDGWDKSYIGTFSALTNLLLYGDMSNEDIELAEYNLRLLQEEFEDRFAALSTEMEAESSVEKREMLMTQANAEMASQAHDLALALYRCYTYGEDSPLIKRNAENSLVLAIAAGILLAVIAGIIGWIYYSKRMKRVGKKGKIRCDERGL